MVEFIHVTFIIIKILGENHRNYIKFLEFLIHHIMTSHITSVVKQNTILNYLNLLY